MIEVGMAIDVGIQRKGKENQDALKVILTGENNSRPPLLIVADGMGGYQGGAIASNLVIDTMAEMYLQTSPGEIDDDFLYMSVLAAHKSIQQWAHNDPSLRKMGSTVVAALIDNDLIHLVNVGDSHAYLVNREDIVQINWDHSLVAEEVRIGNITLEEARHYPGKNILTMSLSASRNDVEPFNNKVKFMSGDTLLLCSDGLWGVVTDAQMQAVVMELSPQRAANKLVEMANANQGPDNISVIVAKKVKDIL
ncbi:MAG: serine/threonine-protein phosphatase [Anaerolineaceae bacterium]|nr:serine/threonine-protein phosphatase [Anaerolineaceae bacterium]